MTSSLARRRTLAGVAFLLAGTTTIQWSAALVMPVFLRIGPSASSAWRFFFGAVALLAVSRPRVRAWTRHQWVGAAALGASTAFMGFCFYQSIARIPLGTAVAIEYLGPFLVAALSKRSLRHYAFVALAGAGVVALARPGGGVTLLGVLFALGSGAGWAGYAFASHRVGGSIEGFGGLAVAMSIAALVTAPFAFASAHVLVARPWLGGRMALVGVAAIGLGFGMEMQALRRIKPSVVSVLIALDPAIAFLMGWLFIGQGVSVTDLVGLACVVGAGVGVTYDVTRGVVPVAQ